MMFFSGTAGMSFTERITPRLGMDLVGGTRVTLLAVTETGQEPSEDAMERAREIIESRVNSLGVEEAEVIVEGDDRIVVSVAGEPENALRQVGDPAELRFRKVIDRVASFGSPDEIDLDQLEELPDPDATPDPDAPEGTPAPDVTGEPEATQEPEADNEGGGQGGQADPTEPPATPPGEIPTVAERRQAVEEKIDDEAMAAALAILDPEAQDQDPEELLEAVRPFADLTGPEVAVLPSLLQFYLPTITCEQLNARPAGSIQDPAEIVTSCDTDGVFKYLLDASTVLGTDVDNANASLPAGSNRWEVSLSFTGEGQPRWTDLTREAVQNDAAVPFDPSAVESYIDADPETGQWSFDTSEQAIEQNNRYQVGDDPDAEAAATAPIQCQETGELGNCLVATVLDNQNVSAPQIQQVITSDARITGDFSAADAQLLASQLRFGALPLTFEPQEEQTITATLGVEYLRAGLLAAAIGASLMLVYVFFYYRLLGAVILGSLVASSLLTYAALVVLGRGIGYTLTLAGISGFIVAVGIAADSFVIYFERLKDEIREGRTPRSAVPRAWVRARRTIITANTVTLLAAVVLYLLSAGQVKGFAFALGLATVLDLLIVFTFRHPIMTLLARTRAFMSPKMSGLGKALELDREQEARIRARARAAEA
ncbi:protein translocase subunit SecD [Natronosporangium hydrolyticum]